MRLSRSMLVSLVLGLVFVAASVKATQLTPGTGPTNPDTFPVGATCIMAGGLCLYSVPSLDTQGTRLGLKTGNTFSIFNAQTPGTAVATGVFLMEATADPSNVFCANCVDLFLQVENDPTSTAKLTRVELSGFTGFLADVGFDGPSVNGAGECGPADAGYCGSIVPDSVDRLTADAIGFTFSTNGGIAPGAATPTLVIETNASGVHDPAGLSITASDGSIVHALGGIFVPAPEPSTVSMLGAGLLGLLGLRKRGLA